MLENNPVVRLFGGLLPQFTGTGPAFLIELAVRFIPLCASRKFLFYYHWQSSSTVVERTMATSMQRRSMQAADTNEPTCSKAQGDAAAGG